MEVETEAVDKIEDSEKKSEEKIDNTESNKEDPEENNGKTEEKEDSKVEAGYEYLHRGYTSEIFKIEIRNLPKHYGMNELKKLLNGKLKLEISKIKCPRPGSKFLFVCFRNEEEKQKGMTKLDGYVWKGSTLNVCEAKASKDPMQKRKHESQSTDSSEPKKIKTVEETSSPLAHLTYEEQLDMKQKKIIEVLKKFQNEIYRQIPDLRKDVFVQKSTDRLPCDLLPIVPSPEIDNYRNKCEFSIGKDRNGEIVVGNRLGSYSDGSLEVGSIQNLKFVPEKMKLAAELFRKFVLQSKMDPYNHETYEGYYRQLTCRYQKNGELMLIIGIHPQKFNIEDKKKFQNDLIEFFKNGDGKELNVTSMYYEEIAKRAPGQKANVMKHIYGSSHITETLLGLKFRISPTSFFQGNTGAAEKLYQCAIDLSKPNENSVVFDICCGTGTIGLCFAKHCKKILGVEIIPDAIEDAKHNAKVNSIENCSFVAGNADHLINSLVKEAKVLGEGEDLECIAIVDPPRAGLQIKSIQHLRNAENINKLVYISCSPEQVIKNWVDLMRPVSKTLKGNPFVPKTAVAVDLFPHTHHVELLIEFQREQDQ